MYTENIALHEYESGNEVELKIEFHYSPPRQQTMTDPAEEEEFELSSIEIEGKEYGIDDIEWSEEEIINAIKEQCVP